MRIVMMGTGTFAEPTFETLLKTFPGEVVGLVTQPDRDVGRRSGSSRQTGVGMANIAKVHNIPVIQPASINSDEGIALLAAMNPDLCVVAAYGQIFKAPVLAVPKLGFINVHASLLPKYRGAAPVAHAILNGETETGVTIFRITTGIDSGEMLARTTIPIPNEIIVPPPVKDHLGSYSYQSLTRMTTTGDIELELAKAGAQICAEVIARMKLGPVAGTKQDETRATRAPKIKKEMGLIDWSKSAVEIVNHIRAMQPWPTAYTFLHRPNKPTVRIKLHAAIRSLRSGTCLPGVIESPAEGFINVTTGDCDVTIIVLQVAGKNPLHTSDFLRGYPLPEGSRFGPERL